MTSTSTRTTAIQPYLVPPSEAQGRRTRVAVFLPAGPVQATIASWMTMSRDIIVTDPGAGKRPRRRRGGAGVDVVVSALIPGENGNELPDGLPYPAARLIVVGPAPHDDDLVAAARSGAWAYCALDAPPQELAAAVRRVHAGECPLLAEISRRPGATAETLQILAQAGRTGATRIRIPSPLTRREGEILRAVAEGANSQEIAERLNLTSQTVRNYMTAILQKVEARTRGQAATTALKNGWL